MLQRGDRRRGIFADRWGTKGVLRQWAQPGHHDHPHHRGSPMTDFTPPRPLDEIVEELERDIVDIDHLIDGANVGGKSEAEPASVESDLMEPPD